VSAVIALAVGLVIIAYLIYTELFPYSSCQYPNCPKAFPNLVPSIELLGSPFFLVGGAIALTVRWRLPHIADHPRGMRTVSVTVLATTATLIGLVCYLGLVTVLVVSVALNP
jgi:hypothetical protein